MATRGETYGDAEKMNHEGAMKEGFSTPDFKDAIPFIREYKDDLRAAIDPTLIEAIKKLGQHDVTTATTDKLAQLKHSLFGVS